MESTSNAEVTSPLDILINHTPFEIHFPGYQFLGPGTHLEERLERGEKGVNPLDAAGLEHDVAYSKPDADRTQADCILAKRAFSRLVSETAEQDEKFAALITVCCMVTKITVDRLVGRVTKLIKKAKKKVKRSVVKKKRDGEGA